MAPKRKQIDSTTSVPVAAAAAAATTRVTRSSSRQANSATVPPPAAEPKPPRNKKVKTKARAAADPVPEPETQDGSKTIIIEHCKQCKSFMTRAVQVKVGLEKGVDGVNVVVNPDKPRKGCFEIREKGGGIFVSFLDMKRPFKPMKDLDMEKVISEIVEKIR